MTSLTTLDNNLSSVKIVGLPGFPPEGLSIDEACAKQPDCMRALGFVVFRQVRLHRDVSADSNLLYLENRFQTVLKETWLIGHRSVLKILDVCKAKLNEEAIEGILFEHGGPQAVIGLYLGARKTPRKIFKIIEGLKHDELVEFATNAGTLQADGSITAWIREKVVKSKRKAIIKYPLAEVPRRVRTSKKHRSAEENTTEGSSEDLEDSENSEDGGEITERKAFKRKRTPQEHSPHEDVLQGVSPRLTTQALESSLMVNKKDTLLESSLEQAGTSVLMEKDESQMAAALLEFDWPGDPQYFDHRYDPTEEHEWTCPDITYFNSRDT